MEDFYVIIPSNVRNVSGEKNTTINFTTYLPRALELDREKWRVGLVHIDYPHSWTNISGDIGQVELKKSGFFLLLDHHVSFRWYEL